MKNEDKKLPLIKLAWSNSLLNKDVDCFQLQNRRYIGSKHKLLEWIFSIIQKECKWNSFADIFAWTGIVWAEASKYFDEVLLNDFLDSNYSIYQAFFWDKIYDTKKIKGIIEKYNKLDANIIKDNYFSKSFWWKYFNKDVAKIIWYIREDIEEQKTCGNLSDKEYYVLIASLIYSTDKVANTVWHYDAYFKNKQISNRFNMKSIKHIEVKESKIFKKDANLLVKEINADIVYIDPPYNSRQYSRFYHVLENLTKWNKPKLYWIALKPAPENISDYCKVSAKKRLEELIRDINAKYIIVSYNNTYESKSNSSKNKITLADIEEILKIRGRTKIFQKDHKFFNAGNTDFKNHKEYLFITKIVNA